MNKDIDLIIAIIQQTRFGSCDGHSDESVRELHDLLGIPNCGRYRTGHSYWPADTTTNLSLRRFVEDRLVDLGDMIDSDQKKAPEKLEPTPHVSALVKLRANAHALTYNELRTAAKALGIKPASGQSKKDWLDAVMQD